MWYCCVLQQSPQVGGYGISGECVELFLESVRVSAVCETFGRFRLRGDVFWVNALALDLFFQVIFLYF